MGQSPEPANSQAHFLEPQPFERIFNRVFGWLVGLGFGGLNSYVLDVRGRKSGRVHSTPVHLLDFQQKQFLVAPRGRTQWVRNAEASGAVTLRRGSSHREFNLLPVPESLRPPILRAYLGTFKSTVQVYFPIPAGSSAEAFIGIAADYPVFELVPRAVS